MTYRATCPVAVPLLLYRSLVVSALHGLHTVVVTVHAGTEGDQAAAHRELLGAGFVMQENRAPARESVIEQQDRVLVHA